MSMVTNVTSWTCALIHYSFTISHFYTEKLNTLCRWTQKQTEQLHPSENTWANTGKLLFTGDTAI